MQGYAYFFFVLSKNKKTISLKLFDFIDEEGTVYMHVFMYSVWACFLNIESKQVMRKQIIGKYFMHACWHKFTEIKISKI